MSALTSTGRPASPAAGRDRPGGGARLADLAWLTWRQHRAAIITALALAAVLTGSMLLLAARIATINQACGNAACPAGATQAAPLLGAFGYQSLARYLAVAVIILPLLAGVFIGIPLLAREHEQRTLLLAWSQDISPQRWLWTKLALLGALTAALAAVVSAAAAHLTGVVSIATARSLFDPSAFLVTGMLPVAQSLAWLAIGVALGAAFRRTLPAIAAALIAYVGAYFLVQDLYPRLMTPLTALVPIGGGGPVFRLGANALIANQGGEILSPSGYVVSPATLSRCMVANGRDRFLDVGCLARHHFMTIMGYQPGSRIPAFHFIMAGGYAALGAVALAAVWWLARRTSLSAG